MLDKELQPIVRQSKQGRRYVDKLVKVWLQSGAERWLLFHVEVQTWKEGDFPKRMHVYNHRVRRFILVCIPSSGGISLGHRDMGHLTYPGSNPRSKAGGEQSMVRRVAA